MTPNQKDNYQKPDDSRLPPADTGNASNPTPHQDNMQPEDHHQLLDEKAETYLREAGNIEDMPDPQEELEAEETEEENS